MRASDKERLSTIRMAQPVKQPSHERITLETRR